MGLGTRNSLSPETVLSWSSPWHNQGGVLWAWVAPGSGSRGERSRVPMQFGESPGCVGTETTDVPETGQDFEQIEEPQGAPASGHRTMKPPARAESDRDMATTPGQCASAKDLR